MVAIYYSLFNSGTGNWSSYNDYANKYNVILLYVIVCMTIYIVYQKRAKFGKL